MHKSNSYFHIKFNICFITFQMMIKLLFLKKKYICASKNWDQNLVFNINILNKHHEGF